MILFQPYKQEADMEEFDLRRCVDYMMEKRWKDYRYELHQYFKKFKTAEEARQHPYGNVTEEDWEWLCTFFENKYSEKRPKKTTATRPELPYTHRAWSKSIFSNFDPEADLFHGTHCTATSHAQTEALRVEMEELRELVQNQQVEVDGLRNIIQDQQERLRRLEERVFATVNQDQQGAIVPGQLERLRRLEERVFPTNEGNESGSGPSNMPGHG